MKIEIELLLLLSELYKAVPMMTPNRSQLIYELASEVWEQRQQDPDRCVQQICIDVHNESFFSTSTDFQLILHDIVYFEQNMPSIRCKLSFYDKLDKFLLPSTYYCCGLKLKIIGYHASVPLYTNNGLITARSYHSKCKKCKCNHYHGFSEDSVGNRTFEHIEDIDVLIFNSGVAFTKSLMMCFDKMICIGAMTFEKLAEFYKSLHSVDINPDRIETSWFLYRILHHVNVFEQWPRKKSKELDVEILCGLVFNHIKDILQKLALQHVCDVIGCKEKFVVIDGNEKLFRAICAIDKEKLDTSPGDINRIKVCINNPLRGNQHSKISKFCKDHQQDCTSPVHDPIDIRPVTRSMTRDIPPTESVAEGCKKNENVNRFYDRSAGMFYIYRPCGYRLARYEMYTAESLSCVYTYLVDLFGEELAQKLHGIVYDRACGLHPFLIRLAREGNDLAHIYSQLHFIVDIFHVEKHEAEKCDITHTNCLYHPHLEKFQFVKGMNTEIAEQSFSRINPFKNSTRKMTYCKRLLYLMFVDEHENDRVFNKPTK